MEETWKDIEGYNGDYQVSTFGRIKSFKQGAQGKILMPIIKENKYVKINLYNQGKMTTYSVHRLVAQAFIPNPDNLPQVNHKDRNPSNNQVSNLEWCDMTYNNNYDGRVERQAKSCTKSKQVLCIDTNEIFYSSGDAARKLGINARLIRGVCLDEHNSTHGLRFKYINEKEGR